MRMPEKERKGTNAGATKGIRKDLEEKKRDIFSTRKRIRKALTALNHAASFRDRDPIHFYFDFTSFASIPSTF